MNTTYIYFLKPTTTCFGFKKKPVSVCPWKHIKVQYRMCIQNAQDWSLKLLYLKFMKHH